MTYTPILVGVDGSRASSAAIRYAAHEALGLGAPLRLVHVLAEFVPMAPMVPLMPSDLEDTGRAILARAVDEACALLPAAQVSSSLIHGPRVRALAQVAIGARLIAFGHERHPTLDRLLTGATVTGVAASRGMPRRGCSARLVRHCRAWLRAGGGEVPGRLLPAAPPRVRGSGATWRPAARRARVGAPGRVRRSHHRDEWTRSSGRTGLPTPSPAPCRRSRTRTRR